MNNETLFLLFILLSMIRLVYQLTEEEFLTYNFYTCWERPERKNLRLRFYIIGVVAVIALVSIVFFNDLSRDGITLYPASLMVIGIAFMMLMIRFRMKSGFDKRARKMLSDSNPNSVLRETEWTFSETGVTGKTAVSEVKFSWDAFQKKAIANRSFYLYTNAQQAMVIPFRVFSSTGEKEEFEKILKQHLPLSADLPVATAK